MKLTKQRTYIIIGSIIMLAALAALIAGCGLFQNSQTLTLPTPSTARSTYSNTQFGYALRYPANWQVSSVSDGSYVQVFALKNPALPQGSAMDITCQLNPSGLSAQHWWQTQLPPNSGEVGQGMVRLSSGAQAYKATGQATGRYDVFTMTASGKVCQIVVNELNSATAAAGKQSANTFVWR